MPDAAVTVALSTVGTSIVTFSTGVEPASAKVIAFSPSNIIFMELAFEFALLY